MLFLNDKEEKPLVIISEKDGFVLIKGKSLMMDTISFYNPIIEHVKNNKMSGLDLHIDLEYISTSTSKSLLELFRNVENEHSKVIWYFDDEDIYNVGCDFQDITDIKFNFVVK